MIVIRIEEKAKEDIKEASVWYNNQRNDLGKIFLESVKKQIENIQSNPKLFGITIKNIRKARLKTFPYNIYFFIDKNEIVVIAIFHTSRNPIVWENRIKH